MKKNIIYILLLCTIFTACKKDKPSENLPFRTVLLYLAANNNLSNEAYDNLNQLEDNIGNIDGNLIIYTKLPGQNAALYQIKNNNGQRQKIKIKDYPIQNSSDANILRQVISEVQQSYPAQSHGLILWSHATGWIPTNISGIKLKSFGDDGGRKMDIKDLNNAIPNKLDFIMFDACSMASLEVLYELKDKANYFIASPGEVIANGMPYSKIVNDLFTKGTQAYTTIAKKYFDHYNAMSGPYRSATISVIDATKLEELAQKTKQLIESQTPLHNDYKRDQIQRMDFDRYDNPLIAFDFLDFIETNYNNNNVANLKSTIQNTIVYKANTPLFNGFEIKTNSGLTTYIPNIENENSVHDYYRTLKWYQASGYNKLF